VRTKIIIGALLVTLVIPGALLVRPQKAEAVASLAACVGAKIKALFTVGTKSVTNAITSVNTSDWVAEQETAVAPAGSDWQDCFLKGFAVIIGKAMLHTFTQSVIKWINSGFQGSPSFVTNPEGFLNNVADQAIGQIIEGISPLLCAPFRINLRFSLGLNLSLNSKDDIHCRLSDVINNVRGAYDGFVGGSVGSGNLSQWIHIAGTPQNNPYGVYIATTNKLSLGITSATGKEVKLLDWGKGFKSWRDCVERGPKVQVKDKDGGLIYNDEEGQQPVMRDGPCIKEGPIKTPGTIIEGETTGALNTTFHELELANEIDAVVGALVNQMLVQVMSAGAGLLGSSQGGGSSGYSYADSLLTDPDEALRIANAVAPEGITCSLRYYASTKPDPKDSKKYVIDDANNRLWTDNLGVGKTVGVTPEDKRKIVEAFYVKPPSPGTLTPLTKPATTPVTTWKDYFKQVKDGCKNFNGRLTKNTSDEEAQKYYDTLKDQSGGGATPPPAGGGNNQNSQTTTGNIATRKMASQSSSKARVSDWRDAINVEAENALDGQKDGNRSFGLSATKDGLGEWWQVDLGRDSRTEKLEWRIDEISNIRIYGPTSITEAQPCADLVVTVLDENKNPISLSGVRDETEPRRENLRYNKSFSPPIAGARYVKVSSSSVTACSIILAEVEVFGKQTTTSGGGNSGENPATPSSFAFAVNNPNDKVTAPKQSLDFPWNDIVFIPNQTQTGIDFKMSWYPCTLQGVCSDSYYATALTAAFPNNFEDVEVHYTIGAGAPIIRKMIENGTDASGSLERSYRNASDGIQSDVQGYLAYPSFYFATDMSVTNGVPITINITSRPAGTVPGRILIRAINHATGASVGSAKFDILK